MTLAVPKYKLECSYKREAEGDCRQKRDGRAGVMPPQAKECDLCQELEEAKTASLPTASRRSTTLILI
jgi:hypothetical protein